jgi:outer membrane protein assembly factor BamB
VRRLTLLFLLVLSPLAIHAQGWSQWGAGPRHRGTLPVSGHPLSKALANIVYDPFVDLERAEGGGSLLVHYQTPLADGGEVFMAVKGGRYTGFRTWETQTWSVRKFDWVAGELVQRWTALSDWDPVFSGGPRFEPVFHAALGNGALYMPAAGGTVLEVDRQSGAIRRRLGAFGELDPTVFVTGPLTVDDAGNIYYNTLKLRASGPWTNNHNGAWLVKITPSGEASRVSYADLTPDAPGANDNCTSEFSGADLPWPPSPNAVAPSIRCGSQRPGINVAPAVAADGTIYTGARAHLNSRWAYLVAVNPDLTPKWAASLRNRFNDGCNVLLPPNGQPGGCKSGATTGVDPSDNQPGSGAINDNSTASPIVAPDGTIFYGTYSRYNFSQGHMTHFSASGQYLGAYPFGWDITPALWEHDGTYSLITKENRYAVGSYCSSAQHCPSVRQPGDYQGFYITQVSPNLEVEWKHRATNTVSCERNPNGSIDCVEDHPFGFEWCVNAPAVDSNGVVYVNSEDGFLYAIEQGGFLRDKIFLQLATFAAYTPLSLGPDGRIYTQNAGHLFAVGLPTTRRRSVRAN